MSAETTQISPTITGGHDTDGRDRGRPVILIAAALKVPSDVFREAFTHVHPAGLGSGGPTEDRARENKHALMTALGPYGVTDERLNEVSNYYRYNRERDDLWRHTSAVVTATIRDGAVVGFTINDGGSGYSSPPVVSIPGLPNVKTVVTLSYGPDFAKNGSIQSVQLDTSAQK